MMFSMNYFNALPIKTISLYAMISILVTIILLLMLVVFRKKLKGKKTRILGFWTLVVVLVFIFFSITGSFGRFVDVKAVDSKEYTKGELIEDLQKVENCIMRENPLIFTDREELKKQFDNTYEKIEEGMTELEFYRLINPLVVDVKCGHTNLSISKALQKNREETAKYFPVKVTLVDNKLYFMEGDQKSGIKAGDQIISINGKSSGQIIQILLDNISGDGDNDAKQRYIVSKHFNSRFFDFVDNSNYFNVEYLDEAGNLKNIGLKATYRSEFNTTAWDLHFTEYQDGNYYDSKIYNDYALLVVRIFMPEKGKDFATFLNEFFLKLKEDDISKLIIDLRGNFGASHEMAKTLLSHLVSKKTAYFTGKLPFLQKLLGFSKPIIPDENHFDGEVIVLTDGANFSTAGHFCAMVKYHKLGTLLGTRTAGTHVCTDSSKDTVLPNTRMRFHYSTLVYQVAVEGLPANEGIAPDIEVKPTINSILNNRDLQMERSLQLLGVE